MVADYFVHTGNYVKGQRYMKRAMRANPAIGNGMYLRLARLGSGNAWEMLDAAHKL